jgi:hypothetical protein
VAEGATANKAFHARSILSQVRHQLEYPPLICSFQVNVTSTNLTDKLNPFAS